MFSSLHFLHVLHDFTAKVLAQQDPTGELTSLKSVLGVLDTLLQEGRLEEVNTLLRRYYSEYYGDEPNEITLRLGLTDN